MVSVEFAYPPRRKHGRTTNIEVAGSMDTKVAVHDALIGAVAHSSSPHMVPTSHNLLGRYRAIVYHPVYQADSTQFTVRDLAREFGSRANDRPSISLALLPIQLDSRDTEVVRLRGIKRYTVLETWLLFPVASYPGTADQILVQQTHEALTESGRIAEQIRDQSLGLRVRRLFDKHVGV